MDHSIRLRTAEDDQAEKVAALKTPITPSASRITCRDAREPKTAQGRRIKLISIPASRPVQPADGA